MKNVNIAHSSRWTASVFISSGSPLTATISTVRAASEDVLTIGFAATNAVIGSTRAWRLHRLSNANRRSRWAAAQSAPPLHGSAVSEVPADPSPVALPHLAPSQPPSKSSRMERIELAIDSLPQYELIKSIPVLVESLGDKVFVAEAPDLNVSTTGNSVGAAFLLLKEQILTAYEGSGGKRGADSDRVRQLSVFEKYISKPRRHWF